MWQYFYKLLSVTDIHGNSVSGHLMRRKTPTGWEYRKETPEEVAERLSIDAW